MTWQAWDAIGSIVGGVSTALAFFGTLWLIVRESRTRRADEQARIEERRDEDMRQARLVLAAPVPFVPEDMDHILGDYSELGCVRIFNHSSAPVYELVVTEKDLPGLEIRVPMIRPDETQEEEYPDATRKSIQVMTAGWNEAHLPDSRQVTLAFTDAAGRRWRRVGYAQPERRFQVGRDLTLLWTVESAISDVVQPRLDERSPD